MTRILALLLSLLSAGAHAAAGIPGVSEADYAALRALVLPYTYELNKPVSVYNWHRAADDSELNVNSKGPKEFASLQKFAGRYWDKQTDPNNTGDVYGTGLYAALDPVATRNYGEGGDGKSWVLTQIRLKQGFRILDVKRDGGVSPTLDHGDLAARLGCPEDWQTQGLLDSLVNPARYIGFPTCAAVIRRLLKDDLKIDGFSYGYSATDFQDCHHPTKSKAGNSYGNQSVALVLTNADKLSPADVSVFSRLTTDDPASRARIQALFVKAKLESSASPSRWGGPTQAQLIAQLKAQGIENYSDWLANPVTTGTTYTGNVGAWFGLYCNQSPSDLALNLANPSPPGTMHVNELRCLTISQALPPSSAYGASQPKDPNAPPAETPALLSRSTGAEFLWDDLEGSAFPAGMHDWMRQNLYACEKGVAYHQANQLPVTGEPAAGDGTESGTHDAR